MAIVRRIGAWAVLALALGAGAAQAADAVIRLKDLSRLKTDRANMLVGYGLVSGLAGTGDSPNNRLTRQSVSNLLEHMGLDIPAADLRARNVAAVMVTASLPRFAQPGDPIDVNVTSMGDARSLLGGTLLITPLKGPDGEIHALAQGALSIGGYKYDLNGNVVQKNHPTAGNIPNGATVEMAARPFVMGADAVVEYVLYEPDMTTVNRIVNTINNAYGQALATPLDPGRYRLRVPASSANGQFDFLARTESLRIAPDRRARVVVNERTGTVVSGGDVRIGQTTISHGDLIVAITTDYDVSQPFAWLGVINSPSVSTTVVPDTSIEVSEGRPLALTLPGNTTVAELVTALNTVKASSRDVITILQGLKSAGALHAELVIQ